MGGLFWAAFTHGLGWGRRGYRHSRIVFAFHSYVTIAAAPKSCRCLLPGLMTALALLFSTSLLQTCLRGSSAICTFHSFSAVSVARRHPLLAITSPLLVSHSYRSLCYLSGLNCVSLVRASVAVVGSGGVMCNIVHRHHYRLYYTHDSSVPVRSASTFRARSPEHVGLVGITSYQPPHPVLPERPGSASPVRALVFPI